MKIIDCFTFYNELDLLFYRLSILYEHVDSFVLVEANQTFSGKAKHSYFLENQERFLPFMDKIILIRVDLPYHWPNIDFSKDEQWINERYQRDAIQMGVNQIQEKVGLDDHDLIVISDIDEIEDPELLISCRKGDIVIPDKGVTIPMDFYYYNLRSKNGESWYGAKMVPYKQLKTTVPESIRNKINVGSLPKKYGWHLSYFGDSQYIQNKMVHFSHQEFNNDFYTNMENIQRRIDNTTDLYERSYIPSMIKIPLENNDYLPPQYETLLKNYL